MRRNMERDGTTLQTKAATVTDDGEVMQAMIRLFESSFELS